MIKSGMYIGGHGYNHIHLKNIDKVKQLKEIDHTKHRMKLPLYDLEPRTE